jgi:hypothetical protein
MAQGNLAHHTPTDVGIGTIRPETDRFVEIPQRPIYTSIDFLMYARARYGVLHFERNACTQTLEFVQ